MLETHPQSTGLTFTPAAKDEVKRSAAMAQTDLLERRQLVETGEHECAPGDVATALVPAEEVRREVLRGAIEDVREEPVGSPGEQIAADEDPGRRSADAISPRALPLDAAEDEHHRSDRRKHHRRHHRHPDSEVPAKPT